VALVGITRIEYGSFQQRCTAVGKMF